MQTKEYNREEFDYHQSENNYTLSIPAKFLDAKSLKVKRKNPDGSFSETEVEIREQNHEILIIATTPMDILVEISDT